MSADPLNLVVEVLQMREEALGAWLAQVDELRRQGSASDPVEKSGRRRRGTAARLISRAQQGPVVPDFRFDGRPVVVVQRRPGGRDQRLEVGSRRSGGLVASRGWVFIRPQLCDVVYCVLDVVHAARRGARRREARQEEAEESSAKDADRRRAGRRQIHGDAGEAVCVDAQGPGQTGGSSGDRGSPACIGGRGPSERCERKSATGCEAQHGKVKRCGGRARKQSSARAIVAHTGRTT